MIIDLILDRWNGKPYKAHDFYMDVYRYRSVFPELSDPITMAMDYGEEEDVKAALCDYVKAEGYNVFFLQRFINAVKWLSDDKQYDSTAVALIGKAGHSSGSGKITEGKKYYVCDTKRTENGEEWYVKCDDGVLISFLSRFVESWFNVYPA